MPGRRAVLAGGSALLGGAGPAALEAGPAAPDILAREAVSRGPVVWYDAGTADAQGRIVAAFNRTHRIVPVQPVRLPDDAAVAARLLADIADGRVTADLAMAGAVPLAGLLARGLVQEVDWAALGVSTAVIADKRAVRVGMSLHALLWNTVALRGLDGPQDWDALLDPRWRGRTGTWSALAGFAQLSRAWGVVRTADFVHRFLDTRPVLVDSPAQLAAMVGSGELALAFGVHDAALPVIRTGAPIGARFPDPTPASSVYAFVPRRAANPAGGALLAAWLASQAGAAAYEDATGRGNPLLPGSRVAALLGSARVAEYPLADTAELQAVSRRLAAMLK